MHGCSLPILMEEHAGMADIMGLTCDGALCDECSLHLWSPGRAHSHVSGQTGPADALKSVDSRQGANLLHDHGKHQRDVGGCRGHGTARCVERGKASCDGDERGVHEGRETVTRKGWARKGDE